MSATPEDIPPSGDAQPVSDVKTPSDHVTTEDPQAKPEEVIDDNMEDEAQAIPAEAEPANTILSSEDLPVNPVDAEAESTTEEKTEETQQSISQPDVAPEESMVNTEPVEVAEPKQQSNQEPESPTEAIDPEPVVAVDSGAPQVDDLEPVDSEPMPETVTEKNSDEPEACVTEPISEESEQLKESGQPELSDQPEEAVAEVNMEPEGEEEPSNEESGSASTPQEGLEHDVEVSGEDVAMEDVEDQPQETEAEKVNKL